MIQRHSLLEKLEKYQDKDLIKIVTGVRYSGKSTLFHLFQERLQEKGVARSQILHFNLESKEFSELLEAKKFHDYILSQCDFAKMNYIFIDEVQMCPEFEKAVNSLFIKNNTDVYLTGPDAYLLSSENATYISGRYIEIPVLPLSFQEFYVEGDIKEAFSSYLEKGSFPFLAIESEQSPTEYLQGIFQTIILKDIAKRANLEDQVSLIETVAKTMVSSIGSKVSIKNITNTLISSGYKVDQALIQRIIKSLCDSYILYKADQFDIQGRALLASDSKYYCVDLGFRNLLLGTENSNLGPIIENIVYFELLRRGYQVYVGNNQGKEVDFVAQKGRDVLYVQVSQTVLDKKTKTREFASLETIQDHFPKLLLTLDDFGNETKPNGIRQENLIQWLINHSS